MSATWQVGPSYSPFIHTTNSQYGAWSGGAGYPVSGPGVARKPGADLIPNPPPARISEVTANDVARIVSSGDPLSGATREKFSDFMSKYGSGRITPLTSQYDRALAMHEAFTPRRRLSHTPGNSPEPETLSETGTSSTTSPRKSFAAAAPPAAPQGHVVREQHFGAPPSRSKDASGSGQSAGQFNYQRTTLGAAPDARAKYPDVTSADYVAKVKDSNNNVLHVCGYRSEQIRPALGRSNTFSGLPNYNDARAGSRYAETRVGLEKLFGDGRRDLANGADPGCGSRAPAEPSPPVSALDDLRAQRSQSVGGASRDAARDYLRSRDSVPESRETGRNSIYWLYGNQGRFRPDSGSNRPSGSLTPYRPTDYMVKSELDYGPVVRHYAAPLADVTRKDANGGYSPRDDLLLQHSSLLDRGGYGSHRSASPYPAERNSDGLDGAVASGYDSSEYGRVPELISRPTGNRKSILKRGQADAGSVHSNATYAEAANCRAARLGLTAAKQLPPLSSFLSTGNGRRNAPGKRVTFNLAMNRCKAFLE